MPSIEIGREVAGLHDVLVDGRLVGKMQALQDGTGYVYRRGPAGGMIVNYSLRAETIPELKELVLADRPA